VYREKRRLLLLMGSVAFAAAGLVLIQLGRPAPAIRGAEPPGLPTGTAVARQDAAGVDVVMWDGRAWITVLPSSAIVPLELGADTYAPRIESVLVSPDGARLGLWVVYCAPSVTERDACTARGYTYGIGARTLSELGPDVAPVAWLHDGDLLVENFGLGFAAVVDPGTGRTTPIDGPDAPYALSQVASGVSPDDDRVLFSGEDGDGIIRRSAGSITLLGAPTAHNTSWLAFDPAGELAARARIRPGEDNRLGGGELQLFAPTGALSATVPAAPDDLDFSPAWAYGGARLAFLRGDASALRRDAPAAGVDAEALPAGLQLYDVGTGRTRRLLVPDLVRRDLVVPGAGRIALLRQPLAGRMTAHWVDLDGGVPAALLLDGCEHTAIGAIR
jgi:hypothetical protein